jgi:hypothetical protein
LRAQQAAFVKFAEENRSPTGRTRDKHGRFHGAISMRPREHFEK